MSVIATNVVLVLNSNGSFTVTNNGLGLPVEINPKTSKTYLEMQLTCLSAFRGDRDRKYFITGGFYGVGMAVINALSEWLEVSIWRHDKIYQQRYERGKAVTTLEASPNPDNKTGTSITFRPDPEIFNNDIRLNINNLKIRLRELAYLNCGLNINHQDNYFNSENLSFNYPQGIKDYLSEVNQNRQVINSEAFYLKSQISDVVVEVALQWCNDNYEEEFFNTFPGLAFYREWQYRYGEESAAIMADSIHVLSFANYTYTFLNGTHVDGLKQGIVNSFNYVYKNKYPHTEVTFDWHKLSHGLTGVVSVLLPEPEFSGPIKWGLANSEIVDIVCNCVEPSLIEYLQRTPQILDLLL